MPDKDYSINAFNDVFESLSNKNILNRNTAMSRKSALNKIAQAVDIEELNDLRNFDLDSAFIRFQNRFSKDYTPDSLQIYLSRARTALQNFISYVDNPSGFRPKASNNAQQASKKTSRLDNKEKTIQIAPETSIINHQQDKNQINTIEIRTNSLTVPIPLREDFTLQISNLPRDLTKQEADRIANIIKAYAITE